MSVRAVPALFGLVCLGLAGAVIADLVSFRPTAQNVTLVGVVLVVVALRVPFLRHGDRSVEPVPDTDRRPAVGSPGQTIEAAVADFRQTTTGFRSESERIVADLRGAAVAVLTRFHGQTEQEAVEQIDEGTWTTDARAASVLARDDQGSSLTERVSSYTGVGSSFETDVQHAAATIAALAATDRTDSSVPAEPEAAATDASTVRTTTAAVEGTSSDDQQQTGHWTGISIVCLLAGGVGAATGSAAAIVAGAIGIGYAGIARALPAPEPTLAVERTVDADDPAPGDELTVTVTMTNEGAWPLADLRIVDGVPAGLAVADGPAKLGTALRAGDTATLEYTVIARRGDHEFDPVLVLARDVTNAVERRVLVDCETTITCSSATQPLDTEVPLRQAAATFAGRLTTADGGDGTEFHSLREYRHGDPLRRVDWNTAAKTGELATQQFHEQRAARVVLLIDARTAAYRAGATEQPHAVDRSVTAAESIATALLARGDTVGLAGLGPVDRTDGSGEACWLAPSAGDHHELELRRLLAEHPQLSTDPPAASVAWSGQLRLLRRRLRSETQVVLFTPLTDYDSKAIARRLDARGHAVTVVSPDTTTDQAASQQLAGVARRLRAAELRGAGIPVIDWQADESLAATLERTTAGGRA